MDIPLPQIVGWAGTIILFPTAWFQVLRNWRRKSAEGLSAWMFGTLVVGLMCMFIASLFDGSSWPIRVQFFIGTVGSAVVLWQMYTYRRR